MTKLHLAAWMALASCLALTPAFAQEGSGDPPTTDALSELADMPAEAWHIGPPGIHWQVGPHTGPLGEAAEIAVSDQYAYADGDGARLLLTATENLTNGSEVGMVAPLSADYVVLFEFDESGYVDDSDRDELDADELMSTMKENEKYANEERERRGFGTLTLTGWAVPPHYDTETNNLEWAIEGVTSEGGTFVNYNTRLLGRGGVMTVTLLASPEDLQQILPSYKALLKGYTYRSGHRYSEFTSGDKVAAYGLAGLIVGGAAAGAAKLGLFAVLGKFLAKAGKLIVVAVVGLFAGLKRLLGIRSDKDS